MQFYAFVFALACFSSTFDCQIQVKGTISELDSVNKFEIKLDVSGGVEPYKYYWYTNKSANKVDFNSKNQVNLNEGNYTVVVQDSNGCHTTKEFSVKAE